MADEIREDIVSAVNIIGERRGCLIQFEPAASGGAPLSPKRLYKGAASSSPKRGSAQPRQMDLSSDSEQSSDPDALDLGFAAAAAGAASSGAGESGSGSATTQARRGSGPAVGAMNFLWPFPARETRASAKKQRQAMEKLSPPFTPPPLGLLASAPMSYRSASSRPPSAR